MAENYDYHQRIQTESWLIAHIENLLLEAKLESSTTSVLYAAFEARNLIEKICYDLLFMSSNSEEWKEIEEKAMGKNGIDNTNSRVKTLRFRFQIFSEQLARVSGLPIKAFMHNEANELEKKLAAYIHTYSRNQSEMNYASDFIQCGIKTVEDTLKFVKSYFVLQNGEYVYGILNPKTLPDSYKAEFESWKESTSTDKEALYNRLIEINKREPLK